VRIHVVILDDDSTAQASIGDYPLPWLGLKRIGLAIRIEMRLGLCLATSSAGIARSSIALNSTADKDFLVVGTAASLRDIAICGTAIRETSHGY
jgi:hypothetical protein